MKKKRINMILAVILSLLFIIGCGGGGGDSQTVIAEPGISLSETSYDFGGIVVNNSVDRQFTITSTGDRNLRITSFSSDNAKFSVPADYDKCSGQSMAKGATCTFIARFIPTAQDAQSGKISISADVPATIKLDGRGYGLNVWINQIVSATCTPEMKVVFDVTVTDPNNPLTTFTVDNFKPSLGAITHGGTPQNITSFDPRDPDSVSVVLSLDLSKSLETAIGNIRTGAKYFVDRLNDGDEAAICKFKNDILFYPATPATFITILGVANKDDLKAKIDSPDPSSEGTALYDAVYDAITRAKSGTKATKAVIVLSDGSNQGIPTHSLDVVIDYAKSEKIPVFTIYYVDPAYASDAKPAILDRLAKETGGQDFYAETATIETIFGRIWSALTKKYRITYTPTSCAGSPLLQVDVGSGVLRGLDTKTIVFR